MAQQVVVAGGGIIGASCAFYMSQRGIKPVVVEACAPACSASGKAGGFLAFNWCDGSALGPLARKSFGLHTELATVLPDDCGYRRVRTHSLEVRAGGSSRRAKPGALPAWMDGPAVHQASIIGTPETTAQVHPERLTLALLRAVERAGGRVRSGTTLMGLELGPGGAVAGVRVRDAASGEEAVLPADAVVLALGAWSSQTLRAILPASAPPPPEVSGTKVHSIVLADPAVATTPDALFLTYRGTDGTCMDSEVYPRPDASVYVCGISSEETPPLRANQVRPTPEGVAALREVAAAVSAELGAAEVLKEQACFLPSSEDGLPLIGPVPGVSGAFLATGHGCWGILNAPATGLAMAELVLDGAATSVNLEAFAPARLLSQKARR